LKYGLVLVLFCGTFGFNCAAAVAAPEPAAGLQNDDQDSKPVVTWQPSSCPCGRCLACETTNFRITWCIDAKALSELAAVCEQRRSKIAATWVPQTAESKWTPRCEIVVHPDVNAYTRCLGRGSEQTSGCSTLTLDQGRVVLRRIDLRADAADWRTDSLPHELTHIVLADEFSTNRIPPWADEGIAMLAESPEKLGRRCDALDSVSAVGRIRAIREIVKLNRRSPQIDPSAFYGQSVGLVAFLLEKGTPQQLLQFIARGQADGYERAMRDVYGVESWSELERGWRTTATRAKLTNFARYERGEPGRATIQLTTDRPRPPP
jgi:hypothetical protein